MKIGTTTAQEIESLTEVFVRQTVDKLLPAVTDVVTRKSSGHFEVHFVNGQFKLAKRNDTL